MKTIVLLLALTSFSSFADYSEFERGFNAGYDACHSKLQEELWSCRAIEKTYSMVLFDIAAEGPTRAQAMNKLINGQNKGCNSLKYEAQVSSCKRLVRSGKATCIQL